MSRKETVLAGAPTGDEVPPAAQARLAEITRSQTWGSALSADEFAAVGSAGFEPVGQVMGAAVYNLGFPGGYGCPAALPGPSQDPAGIATQLSSRGGIGSFGPLVRAMYTARRTAIARMAAECTALGGHGIVGVRLTIGAFPAGGTECTAVGTAVRGQGAHAPPRPFSAHLSGQDFAKLLTAGWVPVGLAMGISIGDRHDDWITGGQTRWWAGNTEIRGYTDLVNATRRDARAQLAADVTRMGAAGVVVATIDLRVHTRDCPARDRRSDHVAEVTIIGTAITPFARTRPTARPASLAVRPLRPQGRQAAGLTASCTNARTSHPPA